MLGLGQFGFFKFHLIWPRFQYQVSLTSFGFSGFRTSPQWKRVQWVKRPKDLNLYKLSHRQLHACTISSYLLDPWVHFLVTKLRPVDFFRLRFGQLNFCYGWYSAVGISGWFSAECMARIYIGLIKHISWHTVLVLYFLLLWWYSADIFCLQCLVSVDNLNRLPHCVVPNACCT